MQDSVVELDVDTDTEILQTVFGVYKTGDVVMVHGHMCMVGAVARKVAERHKHKIPIHCGRGMIYFILPTEIT